MFSRFLMIKIAIVLLACTNVAAITLDGRCAIRFYGESTLHDFEGQVACQPFLLEGHAVAGEKEIILEPEVIVLVTEMDTDNDGRDKKMHSMFDSDNYPEIKGLFADLDPEQVMQQLKKTGQGEGTLEFDLQIRDIKQRIKASTRELTITPEQIGFVMEFPLSLSSYALEPPSVLGMIKVDDQVRVETHVILQRRTDNKTLTAR